MKKSLDQLYALMYAAKARIGRINKQLSLPSTTDEEDVKRRAELKGRKTENEFFIQQINESIEELLK